MLLGISVLIFSQYQYVDSLLLVSKLQAGLGAHLLYLGEEDGTEYAENSDEAVNLSYLRW